MGTSDSSETKAGRRAGRAHRTSSSSTTLAPAREDRTIIVAQGIERQNKDLPEDWQIPKAVVVRLQEGGFDEGIDWASDDQLTYTSRAQGVRYFVRVVTRKNQLQEVLQTPGLHVIYGGHARYGRGPCFGDDPNPGEDWGQGTDPRRFGIFPMAHPYLAVPETEILEHGYTAYPVPTKEIPLRTKDRDKYIKGRRLERIKVRDLVPGVASQLGGVSISDEVWGYNGYTHGRKVRNLVLHAGWKVTGQAIDLGSTEIRCRVFCHFGCSSFDHNYPVVRFLKKWRRKDNDRYAYWTTAPSTSFNRVPWIYHLLTYNTYNAFATWHPHLRYALRKTNQELEDNGYRII